MASTIPKFISSRKGRELLMLVSVVLLGILSFTLGRLSALGYVQGPAVALCNAPSTLEQVPSTVALDPAKQTATALEAVPQAGKYVASKNGTAYHLPWCSGAKRISDENKVWFDTPEAAEAAGYRKAANCKGL